MDQSPEEPYRCPAPRHMCAMNGDFEFVICGSELRDPASIQFKTLTFQRIINQVVPPICIDFTPVILVAGPDNGKHLLSVAYLGVVRKLYPPPPKKNC